MIIIISSSSSLDLVVAGVLKSAVGGRFAYGRTHLRAFNRNDNDQLMIMINIMRMIGIVIMIIMMT